MLLIGDMDRRVRAAARTAASNASKDLVVRSGDIQNDNGKTVVDITSDVIANL
jgi:Skp family chaperone for outer membrane proteins